ncbi:MAG TPA: XRE family transcriptional regulator [Actinopolymorphaceae bacterium]|jgi:hypothetical protein
MSRQELAELVNRYLYRLTKRQFALDANYVGKLERGVIRWPHKIYREAFRAVLNVSDDAQLGFRNPRRPATSSPSKPEDSLLTSAMVESRSVAEPSVYDLLAPTEPNPVPPRIGHDHVEHIRAAAALFRKSDHSYGGGFIREAVTAQLRWAAQLLEAQPPASVRRPLQEAIGELAAVTGFMAFDALAFEEAERIFKFALSCAEVCGNWHLRAKVLSSMARLATWRGNYGLALSLTDLALARTDRLTGTERAMIHVARARAYARIGHIRDTIVEVDLADEAFAGADRANDPPWMAYYDEAQHAGDTGHAMWDLSLRGYPTDGRERLSAAVAGHAPEYVRSRAMSRIKLASLVMATEDPMEAVALGHQALDEIGSLRSRRAMSDLLTLHGIAARHSRIGEVCDLRDRIIERLG